MHKFQIRRYTGEFYSIIPSTFHISSEKEDQKEIRCPSLPQKLFDLLVMNLCKFSDFTYLIKNNSLIFRQTVEETISFFVRLCHDIVFEVLSFGNRRQLTKLERVGRRFHRIAENYFAKAPFILLNLRFSPRFLLSLSRIVKIYKNGCKSVAKYPHIRISYSDISNIYMKLRLRRRFLLANERAALIDIKEPRIFSVGFASLQKTCYFILKKYTKY